MPRPEMGSVTASTGRTHPHAKATNPSPTVPHTRGPAASRSFSQPGSFMPFSAQMNPTAKNGRWRASCGRPATACGGTASVTARSAISATISRPPARPLNSAAKHWAQNKDCRNQKMPIGTTGANTSARSGAGW